ncbi:hypothetical protein A2U01_0056869, partial [Trifolium medium]|nr:hypothetical protein [Trifolium medium]
MGQKDRACARRRTTRARRRRQQQNHLKIGQLRKAQEPLRK